MSYKKMRLYEEIKVEMLNVIDADDNAKAWKQEAAARMKYVNSLIIAAQKVNKDITIDRKALIAEIRDDIAVESTKDQTENSEDQPDAMPGEDAAEETGYPSEEEILSK